MGSSNSSLIMTLVNSIIGVSILAMPFCYKECGILLASLILIFSNLMTRLSCHYLLKSAIMTRRRTFELLAFHALGPAGKTVVEISIILLMIGTCIAFFVVMGDLSPPIIGSVLELQKTSALRPAVLLGIALFVVLPLGLLRNVDSLSSICTASFLFYLFLVFKVFIECTDNLFSGVWIHEVHFWRPAGILQCLPIFSMALSCQTQLLEVFDSAPNGTLDRMNSIVKFAINLCTALYISVGFFGYVGYYKQSFSGNLLMSFSETYFSEFIKLGFVLSVAVTFPLVIFPCRASLHSLLFKKAHVPHYELVTGGGNHIPEAHFKCITFFIITVSLSVGLLAPNIEIVLGLLGSTIGVIICFLCPPILFICISSKATTEKVLAQFLCAFGLFIMIMGTYANLYLSETGNNVELQNRKLVEDFVKVAPDAQLKLSPPKVDPPIVPVVPEVLTPDAKKPPAPVKAQDLANVARKADPLVEAVPPKEDTRVEPPIPEAPPKSKETVEKQDAANDVESKRVEPPVPVAPANDKERAPESVVSGEKDRVKPPASGDQVAANNVAAAASPSSKLSAPVQPKDPVKVGGAVPVAKVKEESPSPLPAVQKPLSDGEKRLLNEQKEVIHKLRGSKNQNGKPAAAPKVEKEVLPKKDPSLVKRAPQPIIEEVKKDEAPVAKSGAQREQKKLPLPLLVHSNAKGEAGSHAEPPKREILENVGPDREKRDLYNVAEGHGEGPASDTEPKVQGSPDAELKEAKVEQHKDSVVEKQKDLSADENLACEKDAKSKATDQEAVRRTLEVGKPKSEVSGAEAKKPRLSKESAESKKVDSFQKPVSREQKAATASVVEDSKSDGLVIAPSKLSDPVVRLPKSIPMDDKLEPALLNVMKPMSRELKTVEDKPEASNKKK